MGAPSADDNRRSLSSNAPGEPARDAGLGTIAFPAVGTGIAGFPLRECAQIMLREAVAHLKGVTSLHTIHFVLFDKAALDAFQDVWKEMRAKKEAL